MMKKLVILLEVLSLIFLIISDGLAEKKVSALVSFSTSKIEFLVDNLSKKYIQYVEASISIDTNNDSEVYCELDIPGIPKDRILIAQGINLNNFSFVPFTKAIKLGTRKGKGPVILRINIQYIPNSQDRPGVYEGRLIFSYRNINTVDKKKESFIPLAQLPIVITIKPIFSVTIHSESRLNKRDIQVNPNTLTFLVPRPGDWEAQETIYLTINTNYSTWSVQCRATELTELVDTESKNKTGKVIPVKTIPATYLYVKIGNSNYIQLSNSPIVIISGNSGGEIGPITLKFMLRTDKNVLAGEYSGNISFLFGGM